MRVSLRSATSRTKKTARAISMAIAIQNFTGILRLRRRDQLQAPPTALIGTAHRLTPNASVVSAADTSTAIMPTITIACTSTRSGSESSGGSEESKSPSRRCICAQSALPFNQLPRRCETGFAMLFCYPQAVLIPVLALVFPEWLLDSAICKRDECQRQRNASKVLLGGVDSYTRYATRTVSYKEISELHDGVPTGGWLGTGRVVLLTDALR
jgi:hypothetical protein